MTVFNGTKKLTINDILTDTYNGKPLIEAFNLIITTPTQTIDTTNYNFYKNGNVGGLTASGKDLKYLAFHKFENGNKTQILTDQNKLISTDVIAYEIAGISSQTNKNIQIDIKIKSKRNFLMNQIEMQITS